MLAVAAWPRRCGGLAEQALSEPERQALLAHTGRPLEEQARWQRAAVGLFGEPRAKRLVAM
jgi:hypothetical protein